MPGWQGECLEMIRDRLTEHGCCHGHDGGKATPPMMYPEWINCVVANAQREASAKMQRRAAKCIRDQGFDTLACNIDELELPEEKQ